MTGDACCHLVRCHKIIVCYLVMNYLFYCGGNIFYSLRLSIESFVEEKSSRHALWFVHVGWLGWIVNNSTWKRRRSSLWKPPLVCTVPLLNKSSIGFTGAKLCHLQGCGIVSTYCKRLGYFCIYVFNGPVCRNSCSVFNRHWMMGWSHGNETDKMYVQCVFWTIKVHVFCKVNMHKLRTYRRW